MHSGPKRLHPATIFIVAIEQARSIIGALAIFLIVRMMGRKSDGIGPELIFAGVGALAIIPALLRFLSVRYEVTDDSFILSSGILYRQKRIIPLERIQNISLKRNVLHRMLGVTTLKIETASGGDAEAELNVIGMNEATHLSSVLQRLEQKPDVHVEPDQALFRASFRDLLLAGATQNKAGVIVLFAFGVLNFARDLIPALFSSAPKMLGPFMGSLATTIGVAVVSLGLLLFAGWILSMFTTLVTYFGFELSRKDGVLRLRHGLFTQIQTSLPVRRIQSMRIILPALQRALGYCHVVADSAASYEDKAAGGAALLTPLIAERKVEDVVHLAFPFVKLDQLEWRRVSPLLIRRSFFRYLLWSVIIVSAIEAAIGPVAFAALPAALAAAWYFAWKRHQILAYCRIAGSVIVRDGVWKRTITVLPEDRIQWVGLVQGPVQRRLGICSLQLVSAAAGVGPAMIVDIPYPAARELQDQLVTTSDERDPMTIGGL